MLFSRLGDESLFPHSQWNWKMVSEEEKEKKFDNFSKQKNLFNSNSISNIENFSFSPCFVCVFTSRHSEIYLLFSTSSHLNWSLTWVFRETQRHWMSAFAQFAITTTRKVFDFISSQTFSECFNANSLTTCKWNENSGSGVYTQRKLCQRSARIFDSQHKRIFLLWYSNHN